jgi:hypothetical protein
LPTADTSAHDVDTLLVAHDLLTLRMHLVSAYRCRLAAERILHRDFEDIAGNPVSWKNLSAVEFSVLASWAAVSGEPAFMRRVPDIHRGLPESLAKQTRPLLRGFLLATGNIAGYRKQSAAIAISDDDAAFADHVRGKRVAIVGPVNTGLRNGKEIDDFDIVVRFNHHDAADYDRTFFGSRTDVSYYTDPAFNKLVIKPKGTLENLQYAVPQNVTALAEKGDISGVKAALRSQYRKSNGIFFKSHGNALQRCLFDLMRFDVRDVKAFNMDMWVSPHDRKYKAKRAIIDPHMFIHHDLISNFLFTKATVANGVIAVDEGLERILAMSPNDYILQLERIHGENFREHQQKALTAAAGEKVHR